MCVYGDGGLERRVILEEGDEVLSDHPFLIRVGVREGKSGVAAEECIFDEIDWIWRRNC